MNNVFEYKNMGWIKYLVILTTLCLLLFIAFSIVYLGFGQILSDFLAPHCINSSDSECGLDLAWSLMFLYGYSFFGIAILTLLTIFLSVNKLYGIKRAIISFIGTLGAFILIFLLIFRF